MYHPLKCSRNRCMPTSHVFLSLNILHVFTSLHVPVYLVFPVSMESNQAAAFVPTLIGISCLMSAEKERMEKSVTKNGAQRSDW